MKKSLVFLALLAAHSALAKDFFFTTEPIYAEHPDSAQAKKFYALCEDSISIEIQRVKSNRPDLDAIINKDIPDEKALADYYQASVSDTLEMTEGMAKEDIGLTICTRELHYRPVYIGHYKSLEQFLVSYYEYAGGAHGIYGDSYYLIDENDRQLSLSDLLEKDGEAGLNALLKAAYIDYVQKQYDDGHEEIADEGRKNHLGKSKPVKGEAALREAGYLDDAYLDAVLTDKNNFYFSPEGLIFSYVPYQAGSFAEGQIELSLSYDKLSGLIKAEYLP